MKDNSLQARAPRWWGMAGVFPGALGVYEGDAWLNKLRFVAERGFNGGSIGPDALGDPARLAQLRELAQRHRQAWFVHYHPDILQEPAGALAVVLAAARTHIARRREGLDLPLAQVVVPGGFHRFRRDFPLDRQLEALAALLRPLAETLGAEGIPLAIENHADYYVSDLVELCGRVPGLSIMLDTGNCFLVGERPDQIPDAAFPLVTCTHFKDHYVAPETKPLNFQLTGATLGEGHVGLEAIYNKLLRLHPDPAAVRLMIEWVPDPAKDPRACFNDSLAFLERLSAGNFKGSALVF